MPAFFVALTAITLFVDPEIGAHGSGRVRRGLHRRDGGRRARALPAIALLHAAGAATAMVFIRNAFAGDIGFDLFGVPVTIEGFPLLPSGHELVRTGTALGAVFAAGRIVERPALRGAAAGCARRPGPHGASLVPLVILFSLWFAFGNLDRDLGHAAVALVLAVGFVAGRRG